MAVLAASVGEGGLGEEVLFRVAGDEGVEERRGAVGLAQAGPRHLYSSGSALGERPAHLPEREPLPGGTARLCCCCCCSPSLLLLLRGGGWCEQAQAAPGEARHKTVACDLHIWRWRATEVGGGRVCLVQKNSFSLPLVPRGKSSEKKVSLQEQATCWFNRSMRSGKAHEAQLKRKPWVCA